MKASEEQNANLYHISHAKTDQITHSSTEVFKSK